MKVNTKSKLFGFSIFFCSIYLLLMYVIIIVTPMFLDMEGVIPKPLQSILLAAFIILFSAEFGTFFFIIFDTIHIAKNPALSGGAKALWICAIWVLNVFVIPVYWMKHQRGDHRH